jgi:hypothetical protein
VDEQPGAGDFHQATVAQAPHVLRQLDQADGHRALDPGFLADNSDLQVTRREIEGDGHEALPRRRL